MAESTDDLDSVAINLNPDQEPDVENSVAISLNPDQEPEVEESVAISLNPNQEPDARDSKGFLESLIDELDKKVITGQATMPVERDSEEYNMKHKYRGKAVIFNQKTFTIDRLNTRNGTDADRDNLAQTLKKLDFEVEIYDDLNYSKLTQKIEDLSSDDHTDRDCLLIAVFSHGIPNKIYTCDAKYNQNELWDPFTAERCPSLAGKPKIFFIQACQGDQLDGGTVMQRKIQLLSSSPGFSETDSAPIRETYTIPNRADFLMVFSTVPGYYSWRNQSKGSWFIQSVCEVLNKQGHDKPLQAMITSASREVALNFESFVPYSEMDQKKQIPYVTSTLIREIYFRPKDPLGECVGRIISGQDVGVEPTITQGGSKKTGLTVFSSLVRPNAKPMKTSNSTDASEADLDMDSLTDVTQKLPKISSPSTRRLTLVRPKESK